MRGTGAIIAAVLATCARVAVADDEPTVVDEPGETEPGLDDLVDASAGTTTESTTDLTVRSTPLVWEDLVSTDCPPRGRVDRQLHLEFSVGGLGGGYRVGPIHGGAFAFHATAGLRHDGLALLADYALLAFAGRPPDAADPRGTIDARIHRAGLLARYSVLTGSESYPTSRADLFVELGVGRQWLRWYDGGRLARNDVRIGVGGQAAFWFGRHDTHEIGATLTFSLVIAGAPAAKQLAPTCAGPCDAPTRTDPYDLAYWLDLGIPFR